MRRPGALVGVAAVAFVTVFVRAQTQRPRTGGPALRLRSGTASVVEGCKGPRYEFGHALAQTSAPSGYAGSPGVRVLPQDRVRHLAQDSPRKMTKPIAEARVEGDFGARFGAYGRSYSTETRDGRCFISISHDKRPAEEVRGAHYTLPARAAPGRLSKLPDRPHLRAAGVLAQRIGTRWVDWKEIRARFPTIRVTICARSGTSPA